MAKVIFYEKPGCANNTRQKAMLAAAGHELITRNLLTEAWTAEALRPFFGSKPVAEWFNRAAPRVKAGEVVPEQIGEDEAIEMMLAEPLLIRRPLMQVEERREAGFNQDLVDEWIGLSQALPEQRKDLETCTKGAHQKACKPKE